MTRTLWCASAILLLLIAAGIAPAASGQADPTRGPVGTPPTFHNSTFIGVGVVGSAPASAVGISGTLIRHRGFGIYADGRVSVQSAVRGPFVMSGITPDEAERRDRDERLRNEDTWLTANLAAVRPVTSEVAFYVGAGYSHRRAHVEFYDATMRRGEAGYYWVEDPDRTGAELNLLGGMIVQAGRHLLFQAGVDRAPRGFTLGAMYATPRR